MIWRNDQGHPLKIWEIIEKIALRKQVKLVKLFLKGNIEPTDDGRPVILHGSFQKQSVCCETSTTGLPLHQVLATSSQITF